MILIIKLGIFFQPFFLKGKNLHLGVEHGLEPGGRERGVKGGSGSSFKEQGAGSLNITTHHIYCFLSSIEMTAHFG
jgi:hypothetical protein